MAAALSNDRKHAGVTDGDGALEGASFSTLAELQRIARVVGGPEVEVEIGKAGGGSFLNTVTRKITLDPEHVAGDPAMAKFVDGHECAHWRITLSPQELGLSDDVIEALYRQLGFGYIQNVTEDGAVNDWLTGTYPGLEECKRDVYDRMFEKDGAVVSTPEIARLAAELGYWPKFAQFGSELLRDWHLWRRELPYYKNLAANAEEGRFSKRVDPEVARALKDAVGPARDAISAVPAFGAPRGEEVLRAHRERFRITAERVYPHAKALIEADERLEALRQMLRQQGPEDLPGLSRGAAEELRKAIDRSIRERAKALKDSLEAARRAREQARADQEKLRDEIGKGSPTKERREAFKEAAERERAAEKNLKDALERNFCPEAAKRLERQMLPMSAGSEGPKDNGPATEGKERGPGKAGAAAGEDLTARIESELRQSGAAPLPAGSLSEGTRRELRKLYDSLPGEVKDALRAAAREALQRLEDAMNEELRGRSNAQRAPSHEERRAGSENEPRLEPSDEAADRMRHQNRPSIEELQEKVREARRSALTPYARAKDEWLDEIVETRREIRRILEPPDEPEVVPYQSSGTVNPERIARAKIDPGVGQKVFDRKLDPKRFDHAIGFLVDGSGSMQGRKAVETFNGCVFAAEVLEPSGVPLTMWLFGDDVALLKGSKESVDSEVVQERMSIIREAPSGGNQDGKAVRTAYAALKKGREQFKFLFVVTDAEVVDQTGLAAALQQIRRERSVIVLHFGIGPGTSDREGYYPFSVGDLSMSKEEPRGGREHRLNRVLPRVLEDTLRNPERYRQWERPMEIGVSTDGRVEVRERR